MSDAQQTSILLEAGTNEVEILVFRLGDRSYGVNVAKVREVIRALPVIDVPHKHPSVVGLFEIRGHILTLIDLSVHLKIRGKSSYDEVEDPENATYDGTIIVTEFNSQRLGFLIDDVDRIHRVAWSQVRPMPKTSLNELPDEQAGLCTGVVTLGEDLVLLIDFESVADSVLEEQRLHVTEVENETGADRASAVVVCAEDSPFMRSQMGKALETSGYTNVHLAADGLEAWSLIDKLGESIDVIVSDIEMPGMDGLTLTRRVREDGRFEDTPLVLFSSLISADNENKGRQVGATLQIAKPELPELVRIVDHLATGTPYEPSAGTMVVGREDGEQRAAA